MTKTVLIIKSKKMNKYTLKGEVILENGKKMTEDYGNSNSSKDEEMIDLVQKDLLPEWNETAMDGYGKTLLRLLKVDEDGNETLIYESENLY